MNDDGRRDAGEDEFRRSGSSISMFLSTSRAEEPDSFYARKSQQHKRPVPGQSPIVLSSPGLDDTVNTPERNLKSESRAYASRTNAGNVICRYNCQDSNGWKSRDGCKAKNLEILNISAGTMSSKTKYMFQRTQEIATVMNDVTTELGSCISECHSLPATGNLMESTAEEDEIYVGRIRSEGKLTGNGVLFEGTLETSSGHIVSLDMSQLDEFFLFPGQVLVISGKNNLGRCVTVSKLIVPRPLPFSSRQIDINKTTGQLSVLIAAGPFSLSDSLTFEVFDDLLATIHETLPDVCFIFGPILDIAHPKLTDGKTIMHETFDQIFMQQVQKISACISSSGTKVILVSSWKEAHHDCVYPTPPYCIDKALSASGIIPVSDPGMISIGGIVFGFTSTDILMHLGREEFAHATIHTDRMGRLARHLLCHRSFYPLYPQDPSVPFDAELWANYGRMTTCTPHILIIPSGLRHFIKQVDGTLVVNPEHITKSNCGGTYARLLFDIPDEFEDSVSFLTDFVQGEIIKI